MKFRWAIDALYVTFVVVIVVICSGFSYITGYDINTVLLVAIIFILVTGLGRVIK